MPDGVPGQSARGTSVPMHCAGISLPPLASTPVELRITPVLLRDQPISLAEILSQSKMLGEHLREAGVERTHQADTSNARAAMAR